MIFEEIWDLIILFILNICFIYWFILFQGIAAKAGNEPCCDWVGDGGAGHFVKMVHNGIEYGDMQLICEAYHLMKSALKMGNEEMSQVSIPFLR